MELLQGVEVLARADELDRHAGHGLDRQGGAAAGVAVELGHDHAVEFQGLVEGLRAADGVLAGHRVDHQEDLVGTDAAVDLGQLAHQFFVDVQAAGRIEDHHLHAAVLGLLDGDLAEGHGVLRGQVGIDGNTKLLAQDLQLLDGRGALQVGRHEHRLAAALLEQLAQLAAGGRLARALQAAEHQHRQFRLEVQRMVHRAHQVDQFLVDDADELVRGVEGLEDRLADGLLGDLGDERLGDLDADVGFQQGRLHQGQPFAHVRLGQPAASAEGPDRRTEVFLKGFEHGYKAQSCGAAASGPPLHGAESHILPNSGPVWQSL